MGEASSSGQKRDKVGVDPVSYPYNWDQLTDVFYRFSCYEINHPHQKEISELIQCFYEEDIVFFDDVLIWSEGQKYYFEKFWSLAQTIGPILRGSFDREKAQREYEDGTLVAPGEVPLNE